ncbi:MAG: ThiF family adenylyltransferase [Bacteroidia bacterium]|nr:ThiF family adenylyltransferase [Bacteroidia bacterium]MBP7259997.1 ThiF family adenylyltransferase [Bacteroidia bacterium]MBP9179704.1 ThiF family adenylyltransferase [Bacteroidia bacterium]MBP9723897.1 ThiF family adenylyltransferase [Bacteroidia bacterium]
MFGNKKRKDKENKNSAANSRESFVILESAYQEVLRTVGSRHPESGGILLGSREDYVIQKFVFDAGGSMSHAAYDPDTNFLNKTIKKEWEENKLALLGFIHSHPRGIDRLSGDWGNNTGDIGYLKGIFRAIPALQKFLVPIMFTPADGGPLKIFPYIAYRGNEEGYQAGEFTIIKDEQYRQEVKPAQEKEKTVDFNPSRLKGSVDYDLLRKSQVTCVGVGGANGICESLVRSGLGSIVLIDFDTVDENNIVTQGYYRNDIGKLKVDVLKERLLNINPRLKIQTVAKDFLKLSESEESTYIGQADLLLMMTDNFHAQAHGNIMGLKYQVPSVFAITYAKARCSEITFTIPGVTPACHRCAVSSRYDEYLNKGYENDVTSTGSTNFHTQYLNSSIGLLSLAILHHETLGFEFSGWFGKKWERNLIQLRTSPFYESNLFARTFEGNERVYSFDSIWQKIEPEAPPKYKQCPDCGGQGDLREAFLFHQSK